MLTLRENASGLNRREFLSVGSLALGGLTLPGLLRARAAVAAAGGPVRDRSVIFLFMHGGPSQTETFDPKMTAPSGIRSMTGEIKTTLPGVTFGGTFEKLARLAHKFTVVRSFVTGDGNHDIKPVVGKHTFGANLGSIYARLAGTNHPVTGLPRNVALFPRAVAPEAQPANMTFGKFGATGPLGSAYAPFVPGGGGTMQEDMQLAIPKERLNDRRGLLSHLDQLRFRLEKTGALEGLDHFQEQAFDTILGGAAQAFDLSREDPRTVSRYDTEPLIHPDRIDKRWNNHKNYADHAKTLGKLLLMARRLCERGCGFITVTTNFVWDMHADQNNATMTEGMGYVGLPFDHAVSAFIEDVEARGLSDKIMLVACGEMGRTPKVNRNGGRDHWGGLAPLLIYGGGLKMGQVIGQSSRDAGEPSSAPVSIGNLVSTIMHTLLDVGQIRATAGVPREVAMVVNGSQPIRELI
jgi:Protein of unknown function (DUF1501)